MPSKRKKPKPRFFINSWYRIKHFFISKFSSSKDIEDEMILLTNADDFNDKVVEDVMVPRSDVVAINEKSSLEELQEVILEHGHTRILVFRENLDNIVGFVHIKDLFEVLVNKKKFNMQSLIRKHLSSPHAMKLADLLKKMQHTRTHMSVVIDEYGGTDGLITIENIIEEIVGRIDDEHDVDQAEEEDFRVVKKGLLLANSRVEIDAIEDIVGGKLQSEDDENDTIGGLVMSISGNVPKKGERVRINNNVEVEIVESTPRMIKRLKIMYKDGSD
ncbi:MAG: hypothetical protein DGJ47_000139 [Rickettsiaceae bacterium]